jgi:hypothetical protein
MMFDREFEMMSSLLSKTGPAIVLAALSPHPALLLVEGRACTGKFVAKISVSGGGRHISFSAVRVPSDLAFGSA